MKRLSHIAAVIVVALAGLTGPAAPVAAAPACAGSAAPATSAPSVTEAAALARACGRRIEDASARTESSLTFANPDGTYTEEIAAVPQRVHRPDGSWQQIDTTLRVNPDGSVSPMASEADLRFSGGGDTALVTIAKSGRRATLGWPRPLPAPTLSGDTATYPSVLPDVDLAVTATRTGFTHVLVVRSAAAAANPALRAIEYSLGGDGVTARASDQGGVVIATDDGVELARAGGATMWDSAGDQKDPSSARGASGGAKRAAVAITVGQGRLTLRPDLALLTRADATFPLYIDPEFNSDAGKWAYADDADVNNTTDRARVGRDPDDGHIYRSFFQFSISALHGSRLLSATFKAKLYHSYSCGDTPATAWGTSGITSPRTAWSPTMATYLDTQSSSANKASCYTPDTPDMNFGGNLRTNLQDAVNAKWLYYVVGLSAMDSQKNGESNQDRWKKFFTDGSYLIVNYNHKPATPTLNQMSIDPSHECINTPLTVNARNGITLRARLTDPNNDNVQAQWSVPGVSPAPANSAFAASNSEFTTFIPASSLVQGSTYTWSVRGYDNTDPGGDSPGCSFTVDNDDPATPAVTSTDVALATGLIVPAALPTSVVGRPARVALTPAGGDKNIAGYLVGVGDGVAAIPSMWVPAAADGTATATIVPVSSANNNVLTVMAKSITGQDGGSAGTATLKFKANPSTRTSAVRLDATGDGRPDVTSLFDVGGGKSTIWRWSGQAGGTVQAPVAPQGVETTYTTAGTLSAGGDFDGDGLSDVATFHSQAGGGVTLAVQRSNGNSLLGQQVWASDVSWTFANMKLVAGNFDGDAAGRTDLAVLYNMGSGNWRLWTFLANGSPGSPSFAAPAIWASVTGGVSQWSAIKVVALDLNGDGKTDIGEYYNRVPNSQTQFYIHLSNGSSFAAGSLIWDSGVGTYEWERSTWVALDLNGDGLQEPVAVVRYDNCRTGLWANRSTGTGLTGLGLLWSSAGGDWCGDKVEAIPGDFNGDGRDDIMAVYRCCGAYQTKLQLFANTGGTFAAPVAQWDGGTGPLGTSTVSIDTSATVKYRIINANSGLCLTVPDSPVSTADGVQLVQHTCTAGSAAQLFTVTRVGPGSNWFHMTSTAGKCIDLPGGAPANGTKIDQSACTAASSGAAQYFQVEYRGGFSNPVVRIVNRSAGTCMDINGASTADLAVVQGWGCNDGPAQDFYVTPGS